MGGVHAVPFIQAWLNGVEALKELSWMFKLFLSNRGLGDVASGGIGGYSVVLMVLAFLRLYRNVKYNALFSVARRRGSNVDETDFGVLFVEFCRFFGRTFNYHDVGLALSPLIQGGVTLFKKAALGYVIIIFFIFLFRVILYLSLIHI